MEILRFMRDFRDFISRFFGILEESDGNVGILLRFD